MFKGYKTVVFNIVMGAVMLVRALSPDVELPSEDQVNSAFDAVEAGLTAIWTVGNLLLRAITDSPIFNKTKVPG